jgi:hypothetical protein
MANGAASLRCDTPAQGTYFLPVSEAYLLYMTFIFFPDSNCFIHVSARRFSDQEAA